MAHVIIRGNNGRRHEVDFENAEIKRGFNSPVQLYPRYDA
jgi:hypothetical protein